MNIKETIMDEIKRMDEEIDTYDKKRKAMEEEHYARMDKISEMAKELEKHTIKCNECVDNYFKTFNQDFMVEADKHTAKIDKILKDMKTVATRQFEI